LQIYKYNTTNSINEIIVGGVENFNKSLELTQRYYNDIMQNNFNYARKIERSSSYKINKNKFSFSFRLID